MRFFLVLLSLRILIKVMGMLQAMRDGSKGIVAKIIVGLIILTFALFGIDSIVALGGGQDAPAVVNGEEISEAKVGQMAQMQKRRLQSQFGEQFNLEDSRLRSIALNGLIDEVVLKQSAKNAGAFFSDSEIDRIILKSPEFQVAGKFDRNQFDLALRSAGFTRSSYRDLLRTNLLVQQSKNAWQLSAFSTETERAQVATLNVQARDFSTVTFSLKDIKKSISISSEESAVYFEQNSSQYMTEETVVVDFIELKRSDLTSAIEVDTDQIETRYQEMVAEAASNKEYRAAHILTLGNNQESKDALSKVAEKAKAGQDFAGLAKEYSEDDSSKYAGGDLGFSSLEVFEPEFSAALAELAVGDVSGVIETRDGLHVIKLLEERQPKIGSLTEMSATIEASLKEEASQASYVEALEILKDEAFSTNSIAEAAISLNLTVQTSKAFSKLGGTGITANKNVIETAFSEVVIAEGANSDVMEIADGQAVVIHLNTFNESKVKPFSEVETQIVSLLENKAASQKLSNKANEALASAQQDEYDASWTKVADKRRASTGVDAAVLSAVFALPEGDKKAYTLVSVNGGDQVLVRLDKVVHAEAVVSDSDDDQKVSRTKAYNEYVAYQKFASEQSEIIRN
jgi:peptidyl-prolyl cis-trans isomerase D